MEDEYGDFKNTLELLNGYLEEYKLVEQHAPEVAARLSFAEYLQYATMNMFGNEQYQLLDRIEDKLELVVKHLADR